MFEKQTLAVRSRVNQYKAKGKDFYCARLEQGKALQAKAGTTYRRYERYYPIAAFVAGFSYDSMTLRRIDLLLDNFILLGYTLAAGCSIAVLGSVQCGRLRHPLVVLHLDWVTLALHFFFGGLLSSYVVYYFQSAGVAKSYIFVGLLVMLLVANEFFSHRLGNIRLQLTIYYFCSFAFFTFFLPTMTRIMNAWMFLASGVLSLLLVAGIWTVIHRRAWFQTREALVHHGWPPLAIFLVLVLFYFQNWMPPVPLALRDYGIYRSVHRTQQGYEVRYAKPGRWSFLTKDESCFHYSGGDTVFCYTAVFAPTALEERIEHHWQKKDRDGDWRTIDKLGYPIVGGRDGGWRGYTYKRNVTEGDWRIEVKTRRGKLLGRISLEVHAAEEKPGEFVVALR